MSYNNEDIYCLDASAFITMHRFYSQKMMPELWSHLESLFKENRLYSHDVVYNEIVPKQGTMDDLAKWMSGYKKYFHSESQRQMDLLSGILAKFPKLINEESEKDQADPYLIAMLVEMMEQKGLFGNESEYVVVSTENERSPNKLPAACKYYDIRHLNLFDFFEANEFDFKVGKK